jgi:hypothetical protein
MQAYPLYLSILENLFKRIPSRIAWEYSLNGRSIECDKHKSNIGPTYKNKLQLIIKKKKKKKKVRVV